MNATQTLVRNLKTIRSVRGMDAASFYHASGVSQQLLSLWSTGKNTPTLKTLDRTAQRLGLKPSSLLAEDPADAIRSGDSGK